MLCSVHILRTLQKNLVQKVCGDFYKNPKLLFVWKVICDAIFLKLTSEDVIATFQIFLIEQKNFLAREIQEKFQNFLNYLDKPF